MEKQSTSEFYEMQITLTYCYKLPFLLAFFLYAITLHSDFDWNSWNLYWTNALLLNYGLDIAEL